MAAELPCKLQAGPAILAKLDAALSRDATCLELRSALTKLLEQATSPLSAIRQEAWVSMVALVERTLAEGTSCALKLEALLAALRLEWPLLLSRLQDCLGAAEGAEVAPADNDWATAASRAVTVPELAAAIQLLQVCLLLHPPARLDCTWFLLKALLQQLHCPAPTLQCASLDALLAMQIHQPPAFVAFTEAGGVELVARLLKAATTSDPVRGRAVRTLNLLLTQVVPTLLPGATGTVATQGSAAAAMPAGEQAMPEGLDEQQAQVWQSLQAATQSVGELLGREARAMLLRRFCLGEPQSEGKLDQLTHGIMLFVETS